MWQSLIGETWLVDLVKQVLGALGLLIVYLVFGRPFLKSLHPNKIEVEQRVVAGEALPAGENAPALANGQAAIPALVNDPTNAAALIRQSDASSGSES